MRARCLTYGVRALFPEVLGGFYTDIEIADAMAENAIAINVTEEGDLTVTNVE
jgi:hypothetical protein